MVVYKDDDDDDNEGSNVLFICACRKNGMAGRSAQQNIVYIYIN